MPRRNFFSHPARLERGRGARRVVQGSSRRLQRHVPWQEIEEGLALSAADIARAEVKLTLSMASIPSAPPPPILTLRAYEYFILPTTQLPPFDVKTPWATEINGVHLANYIDWMKSCWYISATGNPAASVPAGFTAEGLPVGIQIVGRDKQDFSVLQLAHAFEHASNFGTRRPHIALT